MDQSHHPASWYAYFARNMEQLGLALAPSQQNPAAQMGRAMAALAAQIAGRDAAPTPELSMLTSTDPAHLLAAAIGSASVASGRSLACVTQLADVVGYAQRHGLWSPALAQVLLAHSEIYDRSRPNRVVFGQIARARRAA